MGFADNGKIEALKMHIVSNIGYAFNVVNFFEMAELMHMLPNMYHTDNWAVTIGHVVTNQPVTCSTRAPGQPPPPLCRCPSGCLPKLALKQTFCPSP